MTNSRICVFDHDGRFIEWLGKSQYAKREIDCQDNCLICSVLGDTPEMRITKHGYWCTREGPANYDREIWLVHRDPDRGLWNAAITPPIQYVPAAILFVSQRGSSQEFGGKEPQIVEVPFPESEGKAYLPTMMQASIVPQRRRSLRNCYGASTSHWKPGTGVHKTMSWIVSGGLHCFLPAHIGPMPYTCVTMQNTSSICGALFD